MKRKPLANPKFISGDVPLHILDDKKTFFPGSIHALGISIDGGYYGIVAETGIVLSEIEEVYIEKLEKCKFAELRHVTPLHDEVWEFNTEDRKWYLVEQGEGYA